MFSSEIQNVSRLKMVIDASGTPRVFGSRQSNRVKLDREQPDVLCYIIYSNRLTSLVPKPTFRQTPVAVFSIIALDN